MAHSEELTEVVSSVVEQYLLGGPRKYTRTQVAELSGVPADRARKLWVALGFPAAASDEDVEFTDADVAAVRAFAQLDVVGGDPARITAARALGQAMSRLAEWQVDVIADEIGGRTADAPSGESVTELSLSAAERAVEALNGLQDYAWRRHLAAALGRSLAAGGHTRSLLVGFADMVGYTRLTRHLDPDELTALLEAFETTTTETVTANGGWVIKNVGDEVMFAAETPVEGARIALAMHTSIAQAAKKIPEMPGLRVGLAYGPVLSRYGDLYGSVVNIAARLTGVARPGTVLIDDGAAAALGDEGDFALRHLRSVRVKGFSKLRSHVLLHKRHR